MFGSVMPSKGKRPRRTARSAAGRSARWRAAGAGRADEGPVDVPEEHGRCHQDDSSGGRARRGAGQATETHEARRRAGLRTAWWTSRLLADPPPGRGKRTGPLGSRPCDRAATVSTRDASAPPESLDLVDGAQPRDPPRALRGHRPLDLRFVGRTLLQAAAVGVVCGFAGAAFFGVLEYTQRLSSRIWPATRCCGPAARPSPPRRCRAPSAPGCCSSCRRSAASSAAGSPAARPTPAAAAATS